MVNLTIDLVNDLEHSIESLRSCFIVEPCLLFGWREYPLSSANDGASSLPAANFVCGEVTEGRMR